MTLGGLRPGDIVECDVRGDQFFGRVDHRNGKGVVVDPLSCGRSLITVTARQVVGRYRKASGSR